MSWLIVLIIIIFNSLFVVAEVSLLTSKQIRLEKMAQQGSHGAKKALKLSHVPEQYLSMVQAGITLMNILLGLYGGATVADDLVSVIEKYFPAFGEYTHMISNVLVIFFITYLTVLGEIVPKRIAMLSPEKTAVVLSYPVSWIMFISYPLIFMLSQSTKLILRLCKINMSKDNLTVDELKMFINQAAHVGTVEQTEKNMIRRLIHLGDMAVGAVMTPRNQLVYLDMKDSDAKNLEKINKHLFNWFPVINGSLEKIVGIIYVKEIFAMKLKGNKLDLKKHVRSVVYVPETSKLTKLIEILKMNQVKVAMVIDEYGEIEGLVTLNDVLKTFVGDILTVIEGQKPQLVQLRDGAYLVDGNILIEEIMEVLSIDSLPDDEKEEYRTLASFILKQMNRMPKAGDSFDSIGWRFKIVKMDKFRIASVMITPLQRDR